MQIPNYVSISNLSDELAKIENEEEEVKFEELDGNDAKTILKKLLSPNIENLKFLQQVVENILKIKDGSQDPFKLTKSLTKGFTSYLLPNLKNGDEGQKYLYVEVMEK